MTNKKGEALFMEVEIGPHFLTFYTKQLNEMLRDGVELYKLLPKELQRINPQGLLHVNNDPNMYHPFGEPNNWRPWFRHFHIRYGRNPTEQDIEDIKDIGFLKFNDPLIISNLSDQRLPEFEAIEYPDVEKDYNEYIKKLRSGEWLKK